MLLLARYDRPGVTTCAGLCQCGLSQGCLPICVCWPDKGDVEVEDVELVEVELRRLS